MIYIHLSLRTVSGQWRFNKTHFVYLTVHYERGIITTRFKKLFWTRGAAVLVLRYYREDRIQKVSYKIYVPMLYFYRWQIDIIFRTIRRRYLLRWSREGEKSIFGIFIFNNTNVCSLYFSLVYFTVLFFSVKTYV